MYFDRLAIAVAGPRMQHDLKISPSGWGWVIGAFTLSYAIFEIPSGLLGDRIGPRKVLTRIVLWWSAFTALTGAVSSYPLLLAVRFVFGAGEAGAFPNSANVVGRWIPLAERARAASVIWAATGAGSILTPLIVVSLQKVYGWRASFWLFGSLGIFWAALWYWWFRDSPAEKPELSEVERQLIGPPIPHSGRKLPWAKLLRDGNFLRLLLMYHTYCYGAYFFAVVVSNVFADGARTHGRSDEDRGFVASMGRVGGAPRRRVSERSFGAKTFPSTGTMRGWCCRTRTCGDRLGSRDPHSK